MKSTLICPLSALDVPLLSEAGPLAAFPLFGECLVTHWLEHLAERGARRVRIVAADRPDAVRSAVGNGLRWGVMAEVVASEEEEGSAQPPFGELPSLAPPHDRISLGRLPGDEEHSLFENYENWFLSAAAWMPRAMTPLRVRMREAKPGIWVGRRARISPDARLRAPCWIGDQAFVGRDATVGPDAIVEDRTMIESGATVERSYVGPDTFVGSETAIADSIAWGDLWIDWRGKSWSRVPDPFILGPLAPRPGALPIPTPQIGLAPALDRPPVSSVAMPSPSR